VSVDDFVQHSDGQNLNEVKNKDKKEKEEGKVETVEEVKQEFTSSQLKDIEDTIYHISEEEFND